MEEFSINGSKIKFQNEIWCKMKFFTWFQDINVSYAGFSRMLHNLNKNAGTFPGATIMSWSEWISSIFEI